MLPATDGVQRRQSPNEVSAFAEHRGQPPHHAPLQERASRRLQLCHIYAARERHSSLLGLEQTDVWERHTTWTTRATRRLQGEWFSFFTLHYVTLNFGQLDTVSCACTEISVHFILALHFPLHFIKRQWLSDRAGCPITEGFLVQIPLRHCRCVLGWDTSPTFPRVKGAIEIHAIIIHYYYYTFHLKV